MTTVAYRNGVLAVDRMATFGDTVMLEANKLKLLSGDPPTVIACAGNIPIIVSFYDWYESGRKELFRPDPWSNTEKDYITALVLTRDSLNFYSTNTPVPYDIDKYFSIGSGRELALGAMWQGANAVEAVQAANEHSTYSGFGVMYVNIFEGRPTVTICPK